jgi:hypothetical protein
MKGVWKWILLGVAVFVAAFLIALPLFGGWPMMPARFFGFGVLRPGMMGWGGFGWLGALMGLAIPILLIIGVVALVVSLGKAPTPHPPAAQTPTTPCTNCGRPLDPGWVACPYCGNKVK